MEDGYCETRVSAFLFHPEYSFSEFFGWGMNFNNITLQFFGPNFRSVFIQDFLKGILGNLLPFFFRNFIYKINGILSGVRNQNFFSRYKKRIQSVPVI